jgi:hypothetical protein
MRIRFLVPIIVVVGVFSAAAIVWIPWQIGNLLRSELAERGKLAAEALDKSSIGALVVQDERALNHLAKGFIRSNEILYVMVLDKDGRKLADSGIDKRDSPTIERRLPQLVTQDADFISPDQWATTKEPFFHISRPVYYEQLRIGTIVLGLSARRVVWAVSQLHMQLGLLCGVILLIGVGLALIFSHSISQPLQNIAAGIGNESSEQLEMAAGRVKEFNQLVEGILKTRNLFKNSLDELEQQKLELEATLAKVQEENINLVSRLGVFTKKIDTLQQRIEFLQAESKHLTKLLPLVQFATGIAPELDTSMSQVSQSVEQLREDLIRLRNLIALYEKASPSVSEDMEVIQQYKKFINYEQIQQSIDELVTTIRGGANWAEQLADLLKQFSVDDLTKVK